MAALSRGEVIDGWGGAMWSTASRRAGLKAGVISNILTLSQISTFWIDAANGAIILAALLIQRATGEKSEET